MESKKKLIILVVIALILAVTSISLRVVNSSEVPTSGGEGTINSGAGEVGVTIIPTGVEDKLSGDQGGIEK